MPATPQSTMPAAPQSVKEALPAFHRIFSIDVLKAFGIIGVILHHTLTSYRYSSSILWCICAYFICFMAIPVMMIVTGFNYASSFERHDHCKIVSWFSPKRLSSRLARIYIPFFLCFVVEMFLFRYSTPQKIIKAFLTGGGGAGGYYIPQLLQILFYFPFLSYLVRRSPRITLTTCFLIGVLFDFLTSMNFMSLSTYRLLGSRYLIYIGTGICLYESYRTSKKFPFSYPKMFFLAGISWCYILFQAFGDPQRFPVHIFYLQGNDWRFLGIMVFGYALLIVVLVMRFLQRFAWLRGPVWLQKIIVGISQATFQIYLVQKLFFAKYTPAGPLRAACCINVLFCVVLGFLWYYLETRIRSYFKLRRGNELWKKSS